MPGAPDSPGPIGVIGRTPDAGWSGRSSWDSRRPLRVREKGSTLAWSRKERRGSAQSQARGPRRPDDPAAPAPGLALRGAGPPRAAGPRPPGSLCPGPAAGNVGRRHPRPVVRPQPRGLTASTACCRMEVNLENILSWTAAASPGRPESSSIRRRRPAAAPPGPLQSEGRCGAGRDEQGRGAGRPGRFRCVRAARRLRRARRRGGRRGGRSGADSGPRDAPAAVAPAPASALASDTVAARLGFLPPALPAAACRCAAAAWGGPRQARRTLWLGGRTPRGREEAPREVAQLRLGPESGLAAAASVSCPHTVMLTFKKHSRSHCDLSLQWK